MPVSGPPVSAYSPAETWSFNGLALSQPYWNISSFGGSRFALPTLRGQNYAVPYRAGQAQRAKFPDQRTLTLAMWVDGANGSPVDSYPPADQRLAFNNAFQALRQAIFQLGANGSAQGQLERQWYIKQGTAKLVAATAMAEFAGSMEPAMNSRVNAAFSVDFLLADPFFYGALQTVAVTTSGGTITGLGEGVAGIGFPSAVNSFTVAITAACTVTNTTAGVAFTFNPVGSPTYPVTLDILNYTAVDSAGANWIAAVSHTGSRTWMVILPGSNAITNSAGTATFKFSDCYV